MIRAGDPKPQPGSPRYIRHRKRIFIIVVTAYLLYTIYEADWEIRSAGDFYQDLGVPLGATEREIKSKFRRLAALHHPDKVGASAQSEGYFVHLKLAQDTLLNPAKRFAYERFGPDMLQWQRCASKRDFVIQGLQATLPYYLVSAVVMYTLGFMGFLQFGTYWRWVSFVCLCVFEVHTLSREFFPPIAKQFINPAFALFSNHPPYIPFQLIQMAKKLSIALYIALSQIGPHLQRPSKVASNVTPEVALQQQLDRLEKTAKLTQDEASRLIVMGLTPFAGDENDPEMKLIQSKTKDWLVSNTVKSDVEVRDAFGRALQRRRTDAPAGARGNR